MLLERFEKIGQLQVCDVICRHVLTARLNQRLGQVLFEALQVHDVVFDGVPHNQSVDNDSAGLANAMRSVHCLQVVHGVPVVLGEDDNIGSRQIQAQSAHLGSQDEHSNRLVVVELVHDLVTVLRRARAQ